MARIDLKNATIRLIDGFSNTQAVNDTPANGDAFLDIDTPGESGELPVGARFTIVGSTRTYYVNDSDNVRQLVTVSATGGNFTLTFTGTKANPISPQTTASIAENAADTDVQTALEGLAGIAPGDVTVTGSAGGPWTIVFAGAYDGLAMNMLTGNDVDLTGGSDFIRTSPARIHFTPALATADGIPADDAVITVTGRTLEVNIGDGNLTYTEAIERIYELNRGLLDTVKNGDEQPMEVTMDFIWEFLTAIQGADTPTIEDALKNRGAAADWESSDTADPCAPFALDIEVEYVPPCGGVQRELITLHDFRYESLDHNFTDAQVACSGKCNVTEATAVRAA